MIVFDGWELDEIILFFTFVYAVVAYGVAGQRKRPINTSGDGLISLSLHRSGAELRELNEGGANANHKLFATNWKRAERRHGNWKEPINNSILVKRSAASAPFSGRRYRFVSRVSIVKRHLFCHLASTSSTIVHFLISLTRWRFVICKNCRDYSIQTTTKNSKLNCQLLSDVYANEANASKIKRV